MKKIKKNLALIPISGTLVVGAFFGIRALNNNNIYNQSVATMLQNETNFSTNVEADNNWISLEEAYLDIWSQVKDRPNTDTKLTIELNQNVIFDSFDETNVNGTIVTKVVSRNFEQVIKANDSSVTDADIQAKFKNIEIDMNGHVVKSEINFDQYIEQDTFNEIYSIGGSSNQHNPYMFNKLDQVTFKNGTFINTPFFANEIVDSNFTNVVFTDVNLTNLGYENEEQTSYDINLPSEGVVDISIIAKNVTNSDFVNFSLENVIISKNEIKFNTKTTDKPSDVDFNLLMNHVDGSNFINTTFANVEFIDNNLFLTSLDSGKYYSFDVINEMSKTNFNNFIFDTFIVENNSIEGEGAKKYSLIENINGPSNILDFSFMNWKDDDTLSSTSLYRNTGDIEKNLKLTRGYLDDQTAKFVEGTGIILPKDSIITESDLANPETVAKADQFNDKIWDKTFAFGETDTLLTGLSLKPFVDLNQVEYIVPMILSENNQKATFASHFNKEFISSKEISEANAAVLDNGNVEINIYGKDGKVSDLTQPVDVIEGKDGVFSSQLTYDIEITTFNSKGEEQTPIESKDLDTYASDHIISFRPNEDATEQQLADANTYAGLLYGNSFTAGKQVSNVVAPKGDSNHDLNDGIDFTEYNYSIEFDKLNGDDQQVIEGVNGSFGGYDLKDIFTEKNQNDVQIETNLNVTFSLIPNNPEENGAFTFSLGNLLNPEITNEELDNSLISKFNAQSAGESISNLTSRLDTLISTGNEYTLDTLTHKLILIDGPTPKTSLRETITMKVVNIEQPIELNADEILTDDNPASKVDAFGITNVKNNDNSIDVTIQTKMIDDSELQSTDEISYLYKVQYNVLDVNGNQIETNKEALAEINGLTTIVKINNISENNSVVINNIKLIQVTNSTPTASIETTETILASKLTYIQHKFIPDTTPTPRNSTYIVITTMSVLLLLVLLISMIVIFRTSSKNRTVVEGLDDLDQDIDSNES